MFRTQNTLEDYSVHNSLNQERFYFIYLFILFRRNSSKNTITKIWPCKVYALEPHFSVTILGYAGIYIFFLF